MIIKSINRADIRTISYRGKKVKTGIFKMPVSTEMEVTTKGLSGDNVVDKRYHGDYDKGLYAYGSEQYEFWKPQYPDLDFQWGMFGENLTVDGLDEGEIFVGDRWLIGEEVIVEVSQPREPCFKLGARFETQKVVKAFAKSNYPGAYLRIIQPGIINAGDEITIVKNDKERLSIGEVWKCLFHEKDIDGIKRALAHPLLAEDSKETLLKRL